MQTGSIECLPPPQLPKIRDIEAAHKQAQKLATLSLTKAGGAIQAARKAGTLLKQVKEHCESPIEFARWLKENASDDLQAWAESYLKASSLQLELRLSDSSPAVVRQAMLLLDIVPMVERAPGQDHGENAAHFERDLVRAAERLQRICSSIPADRIRVYQTQFRQLYEWMRRELYHEP